MKRFELAVLAGALAVLSGCAALVADDARRVDYVCEGGGGFSLGWRGGETVIEYERMSFALQPEAADPGEDVMACSMLRLVRRGDVARLEIDGGAHLKDCRPRR